MATVSRPLHRKYGPLREALRRDGPIVRPPAPGERLATTNAIAHPRLYWSPSEAVIAPP